MNWLIIIILFLIFWLFSSSLLYGFIRLTRSKEIAKRNFKFLSFLVFCGLAVGFFLPRFLGTAVLNSFPLVTAILLGGYLIVANLNWYYQKAQAGETLINLGRPRRKSYYFWTGVFLLILAMVQALALLFVDFEPFLFYNLLWIGVLALLFLNISLSTCELRENAFFVDLNIWHWSDIKAYEWQGNQPTYLMLWLKHPFLNRCRFAVTPTQQQDLEEILRDRIPKQA